GVGVNLAGVFVAIGHDDEDHFVRPVALGQGFEVVAGFGDGLADGVPERGVVTGNKVLGREGGRVLDADGAEDGINSEAVELDEGEGAVAGDGFVAANEVVEAADGGVADAGHGTRAVEDESDMGGIFHDFVRVTFLRTLSTRADRASPVTSLRLTSKSSNASSHSHCSRAAGSS